MPAKAPDPQQWLALDESDRIDLAIEYPHRRHLQWAPQMFQVAALP
jgi:hypothetical protein